MPFKHVLTDEAVTFTVGALASLPNAASQQTNVVIRRFAINGGEPVSPR